MPYIEIEYNAGGVIEKKRTFSARHNQKGIKRSQNISPTTEAVQIVNDNNAEMNLRHKLYCNFQDGYHLTGTFFKDSRPTPEEAKKIVKKFLAYCRKHFRTVLNKEFKYIYVIEYQQTAIHAHIVIEGVDVRPLQKFWKKNGALRATLINDIDHLTKLAHYLIKETKNKYDKNGRHVRRYFASKNLIQPTIKKHIVAAHTWKEPKAPQGYYLDKQVGDGKGFYDYENLLNGMPCQFVRLISYETQEVQRWREYNANNI